MGMVTFTVPALSAGVKPERVLCVQFDIEAEGLRAAHEFNVESLFIAEANNTRNAAHIERVAQYLRGLANNLDALAVKFRAPEQEPDA